MTVAPNPIAQSSPHTQSLYPPQVVCLDAHPAACVQHRAAQLDDRHMREPVQLQQGQLQPGDVQSAEVHGQNKSFFQKIGRKFKGCMCLCVHVDARNAQSDFVF
eukprot:354283-Chlamydomonas_euryale.AAC.5